MIGRTNGGGLNISDTDAVLLVRAPAGSVVTLSRGGASRSDNGHVNPTSSSVYDYYFIIHQGQFSSSPWTVTATLGTQSISETVVINSSDAYYMTLSYTLWLIYNGASQFGTITGLALKTSAEASSAQTPAITTGTGYTQIGWTSGASSGNAGSGIGYFSDSRIDLSKYKTIHVDGTLRNPTSYYTNNTLQAWTAIGSNQQQNRLFAQPVSMSTDSSSYVAYNTDIDISSVSGVAYLGFSGYRGTSNYTTLRVANLYLEA